MAARTSSSTTTAATRRSCCNGSGMSEAAGSPRSCHEQGRERPVRSPRPRLLPHLLQRAEGRGPIPGLLLDGRGRLRPPEPGMALTLGADRGGRVEGKAADLQRGGLCRPEGSHGVHPGHRQGGTGPASRGRLRPVGPAGRLGRRGRQADEPPGVLSGQVLSPGPRPCQPMCLLRLPEGEGVPPDQQGGPEGLHEPPQAAAQAPGQPGGGARGRLLPLLPGSTDRPAPGEDVQQARLRPRVRPEGSAAG